MWVLVWPLIRSWLVISTLAGSAQEWCSMSFIFYILSKHDQITCKVMLTSNEDCFWISINCVDNCLLLFDMISFHLHWHKYSNLIDNKVPIKTLLPYWSRKLLSANIWSQVNRGVQQSLLLSCSHINLRGRVVSSFTHDKENTKKIWAPYLKEPYVKIILPLWRNKFRNETSLTVFVPLCNHTLHIYVFSD